MAWLLNAANSAGQILGHFTDLLTLYLQWPKVEKLNPLLVSESSNLLKRAIKQVTRARKNKDLRLHSHCSEEQKKKNNFTAF